MLVFLAGTARAQVIAPNFIAFAFKGIVTHNGIYHFIICQYATCISVSKLHWLLWVRFQFRYCCLRFL